MFSIPASHPCLAGHFPGDPMVPGVLLLDAALAMATEPLRGLALVKFLGIVRAGDEVVVTMAPPDERGRVAFTCAVAGADVLRGFALTFAAA